MNFKLIFLFFASLALLVNSGDFLKWEASSEHVFGSVLNSHSKSAAKMARVICKSYKGEHLASEVVYPGTFVGSHHTTLADHAEELNPLILGALLPVWALVKDDRLNVLSFAAVLGFEAFVVHAISKSPTWLLHRDRESGRNVLHYVCLSDSGNIFSSLSQLYADDESYKLIFANAWSSLDKFKKTAYEYCLDYASDDTYKIYADQKIFDFIFDDGSTPVLRLIQQGQIGFVKHLLKIQPDLIYGSSSYYGNLIQYLLSVNRPFTEEDISLIRMIWQFFPMTFHTRTIFGVNAFDIINRRNYNSTMEARKKFWETLYPDKINLSPFKNRKDLVNLPKEAMTLLKSNVSELGKSEAKRLGFFNPIFQQPFASHESAIDLQRCIEMNLRDEVEYMLQIYDFRTLHPADLAKAYLRAIKYPAMFKTVLGGRENFFLARYNYAQYEPFVKKEKLSLIGHNGTLTLPSILVLGEHYQCLQVLLEVADDAFHDRDELDRTSLMHSVIVNDTKAVSLHLRITFYERLLRYHDIEGKNALRLAVESELSECTCMLHRALSMKKELFNLQDGYGTIHYIAEFGTLNLFKRVLNESGDIHVQHVTTNWDNVLHLVIRNEKHRSLEYVKYITEKRPDLLVSRNCDFKLPIDTIMDEMKGDKDTAKVYLKYLEDFSRKVWQESWSRDPKNSAKKTSKESSIKKDTLITETTVTKPNRNVTTSDNADIDPNLLKELLEMKLSNPDAVSKKNKKKKKRRKMNIKPVKAIHKNSETLIDDEVEEADPEEQAQEQPRNAQAQLTVTEQSSIKAFDQSYQDQGWTVVSSKDFVSSSNSKKKVGFKKRHLHESRTDVLNIKRPPTPMPLKSLNVDSDDDDYDGFEDYNSSNQDTLRDKDLNEIDETDINMEMDETLAQDYNHEIVFNEIDEDVKPKPRKIVFGSFSAPSTPLPTLPDLNPLGRRSCHVVNFSNLEGDQVFDAYDYDNNNDNDKSGENGGNDDNDKSSENGENHEISVLESLFEILFDLMNSYARISPIDDRTYFKQLYSVWKDFRDECMRIGFFAMDDCMWQFSSNLHEACVSVVNDNTSNRHYNFAILINDFVRQSPWENDEKEFCMETAFVEYLGLAMKLYSMHPIQRSLDSNFDRLLAVTTTANYNLNSRLAQLNSIGIWTFLARLGLYQDTQIIASLHSSSMAWTTFEREKWDTYNSIIYFDKIKNLF